MTGEERVFGIIQARMGSHRLPGKMMRMLKNHPAIEWVCRRVQKSSELDGVVVAIPDSPANDVLAAYLHKLGMDVFRGNENDVVSRFYDAAVKFGVSHVVRICADNPFVAWTEIDALVRFGLSSKVDYCYNHIPRNNQYPDGLGAEMVPFEILGTIHRETRDRKHREHVFNYIWANPERFSIGTFQPENTRLWHPELKLDLDTEQDFKKLDRLKVGIDMSAEEIVAAALAEGL